VKLSHILKSEHVFLDIPGDSREQVLTHISRGLEDLGALKRADEVVGLLLDRERLGATLVGEEAALPHCKVPGLKSVVAAFARSRQPVAFGEDGHGEKVRLFFFVLSPRDQPAAHLQVLAAIARLLRNPQAREAFLKAESVEELAASLRSLEGAA
jgi:nitrogen PTS system EIIA component